MSNQRFSPKFKDEAVRQNVDHDYSAAAVSEHLGVSHRRVLGGVITEFMAIWFTGFDVF